MMKNVNWDKMWIGFIVGFLTPLTAYGIYYFIGNTFELRRVNVSLCMVANLLPFFLTLNRELYKSSRGILFATVFWAIVIACLSFFTNQLHIL